MVSDTAYSNAFNSHGGGQNITQGDHPIGHQTNNSSVSQTSVGNANIIAGSGPINIGHYHASAPPPIIPRQIPTLEPCFLHRDEELVWLNERLMPGTVVAICGPGGMGKSALAAQAVHRLDAARFPDGIVFHSFYHQPSIEQALHAIIGAFGFKAAEADLESTMRQVLAGKKALLILDGAEEAKDIKTVLDLRGQCGVLITSRKTEDAQDELWELKRLPKAQAAEIFRRYSKVVADDATVLSICTRLGCWPVALRIAGRYLRRTKEYAADYLLWLEKKPLQELGSGAHQHENATLLLRRSVDAVSADARIALALVETLAFAPIAREPLAFILEDDERRARNANSTSWSITAC